MYVIMVLGTTAFILLYGRRHQARALHLWMLALIFFIAMTVGARALWALVSDVNLIKAFAWSAIMRGGLWGGQVALVVLAVGYILIFTRKRGLYLDIAAISFSLGLFIAKLGCIFSGCCWGKVTTPPWGMVFSKNLSGYSTEPRHPTQLYDSLSGLMIFVILLVLARKRKMTNRLFLIFILLYGATKFISEFFRAAESFSGPVRYLSYSQIGELVAVILVFLFLTILKGIWQKILVKGGAPGKTVP